MIARRRALTGLTALALLAGSALAAAPATQAAGATRTVETLDFVNPNHLLGVCGFPVSLHVRGSFNVVSFTDAEGNLTKEIRNFRFRSTLTGPNGVSVDGISFGPEIWTYSPDGTAQMAVHGVVNRRVPGQGTVTLFAGYEVVFIEGDAEVVIAGPAGQRESAEQLCAVFAP